MHCGRWKEQRALLEAKLAGTEKEFRLQQQINEILKAAPDLDRAYVESLVRGNAALEERLKRQAEMQELFDSIGATIEGGILDSINAGIDAMVDGTKDLDEALQEIASGVLKDIGQMLIKFGLNTLFSSLGGGGGSGLGGLFGNLFRADGGPVSAGRPYIVGEEGPELVVPRNSGTVLSNRDSQAALSRYSPANARSIEELAMYGGGAQGSKSGFLGPVAAPETTFKLETVVINGVEYATVDQVRKMGLQATKQGAKQGEAMTLRRLQMSPGARRRAGI